MRYLVSDRAKALIQLAEKGLECLSIPDFFHLVHDIVKSYSLALGQRLKQARQELQKAEETDSEGTTRRAREVRPTVRPRIRWRAARGGDALGSDTARVSAAA